ncbi:hypothetical protein FZ983_01565 [Azospirillum sp. B21]|uniref:hypothetical protein n=1 Tax=Azospirillum sp. B21 TaxID=2607496 RepID=UPI0011EC1A52|nr:hypothetical protein [Azospirillum sp. B21]KAA0583330.1 hypothetical protein FZ983_01565 [Azospirillum sp. B21]
MEPHISFQHAACKIRWSYGLIESLKKEIGAFSDKKPFNVSLVKAPDFTGYLLHVELTEPVPDTIPCMIGDICHNLRSVGDFCWMGLRRSQNIGDQKKTLPICDNAKGLEKIVDQSFVGDMRDKAKDVLVNKIRSHRDFISGGNKILAELNHLSNWQKHNMLVPSFAVTELGENTVIRSNDGSVIRMGKAKVMGPRIAGIGGTYAEMTYDSEPDIDMLIGLKYTEYSYSVVNVVVEFHNMMCEILNYFCGTWPSEMNPRYNR